MIFSNKWRTADSTEDCSAALLGTLGSGLSGLEWSGVAVIAIDSFLSLAGKLRDAFADKRFDAFNEVVRASGFGLQLRFKGQLLG